MSETIIALGDVYENEEVPAWARSVVGRAIDDLHAAGDVERLRAAAMAIYEAGYWTCDRPVDAAALWTELRDALGREPGKSPKPLDSARVVGIPGYVADLLREAKCPRRGCIGGRIEFFGGSGAIMHEPCAWCADREKALTESVSNVSCPDYATELFNALAELHAETAEAIRAKYQGGCHAEKENARDGGDPVSAEGQEIQGRGRGAGVRASSTDGGARGQAAGARDLQDVQEGCAGDGRGRKGADEPPVVSRQDLGEWLTRKVAELGDEPEPMACGGSLPSCMCCGHIGKPKVWLIDHPEVYVCERCKAATVDVTPKMGDPK